MKKINRFLLCLTALLAAFLLTGCNSTDGEQAELESLIEDSNWADLLPEESTAETPSPSPNTVEPELPQERENPRQDVTADYEGTFVGLWDNEDLSLRYDFQKGGKLLLTQQATDQQQTWNWKVMDENGMSRLYLTAEGEREHVYSFTLSSASAMTLYNPDSGNAVEKLTRVKEDAQVSPPPAEETTVTPAPVATATPEPSEKPAQSEQDDEKEETETERTPESSAKPDESTGNEPAPTAQPDEPDKPNVDENSKDAESRRIEQELTAVADYSTMETVVSCIAMGCSFDLQDTESFWKIMAFHLSKSGPETFLGEDDVTYFYVSESEIRAVAAEIYSDYDPSTPLPNPTGTGYASLPEEGTSGYKLRYGQAPTYERYYTSYDGNVVGIEIEGEAYEVVLENGRIDAVNRVS